MKYYCEVCKKKYSSYHSIWNHNKKFHANEQTNEQTNEQINKQTNEQINEQIDEQLNICDYCNKKYKNKYILNTHQKICSIKKYNDQQNNVHNKSIQIINNELLLKIKLIEAKIEQLKLKQIKEEKQKIKEEKEILKLKLELKTTQNTTNNINININNNIKNINNQLLNNSNNTNNTFNIISIGRENIQELLSQIEKKTILNSRFNCIEELVKIIHCGKYDQFKNILITNLKDNYAYKYDSTLNKFICINKNELIHDIVDERLENIREIYEELSTTNKINDSTKRLIKEFLNKMTNEDKYTEDSEGTTYKNFRTFKEHRVKILIYNNIDKISKDLAIILEKSFDNKIED